MPSALIYLRVSTDEQAQYDTARRGLDDLRSRIEREEELAEAQLRGAQALPGGQDIGTFQVVDLNGAVVESATEAFISKAPDNTYGADVGKRAWELMLTELVRSIEEPA
jgi:hypothetical protein